MVSSTYTAHTESLTAFDPALDGHTPTPTTSYVLDTSVLLSDPWALRKFAEHEVVVPLVVIGELEQKRHHPELGWYAREALRFLEDLRSTYGRLDQPIPVSKEGGTLRVELNHQDPSILPSAFAKDFQNDHRILACALNLQKEGHRVTLVTKDIPLRVKAGAVGLEADEYHAQDVVSSGYTGMAHAEVEKSVIDALYRDGVVEVDVIDTISKEPVSSLSLIHI